jgi:alkanesulfonate monooxygenase SsuD/methylene tetrahydromethanopterin reductase-like flavin-dependent oxidoreductase (luciferase family)
LTLLAAVAAVTRRMTVGTALLIAMLRHPLPLASQITTLDQAATGRLCLGIGSGWPGPETQAEFESVGMPFSERIGRLDEAVTWLKDAWAAQPVIWQRRYWDLPGLRCLPPPVNPGGPPLWLGGGDTPKVIMRVARYYDGWIPYLPDASRYAHAWGAIREAAASAGRDPAAITPALYATINLNADRAQAEAELDDYARGYYGQPLAQMSRLQAFFGGPADECTTWLEHYVQAGARHLILRMGTLRPAEQLDMAAEMLPALRAESLNICPPGDVSGRRR